MLMGQQKNPVCYRKLWKKILEMTVQLTKHFLWGKSCSFWSETKPKKLVTPDYVRKQPLEVFYKKDVL